MREFGQVKRNIIGKLLKHGIDFELKKRKAQFGERANCDYVLTSDVEGVNSHMN